MADAPLPFRIETIDHVVLRVGNLEASLAFYCGLLGCTIERRLDELGLIQLRAGAALIDLVPIAGVLGRKGGGGPTREGRNLDHFALRIAPFDEAAIRAHLHNHDLSAGALGQRYGATGLGPSIYLADPDGNIIELKGPSN